MLMTGAVTMRGTVTRDITRGLAVDSPEQVTTGGPVDVDFPPDPDGRGKGKPFCVYVDDGPEPIPCIKDPEYFIRGYCWDPACLHVHTWYYCLRHYAVTIGKLAHQWCVLGASFEVAMQIRAGNVPVRYQILEWGRMGEEGEHPLPAPPDIRQLG